MKSTKIEPRDPWWDASNWNSSTLSTNTLYLLFLSFSKQNFGTFHSLASGGHTYQSITRCFKGGHEVTGTHTPTWDPVTSVCPDYYTRIPVSCLLTLAWTVEVLWPCCTRVSSASVFQLQDSASPTVVLCDSGGNNLYYIQCRLRTRCLFIYY
jgi:hypothetical protein